MTNVLLWTKMLGISTVRHAMLPRRHSLGHVRLHVHHCWTAATTAIWRVVHARLVLELPRHVWRAPLV